MCALQSNSASSLRGSQRFHYNSHWLPTTLSELDEKTKAMLALIEEDGDSFAQRAEMYYKKRPELIKMVDEFQKSYRCLAERHDQFLRYDSTRTPHHRVSSSTNTIEQVQNEDDDAVTSKYKYNIVHQNKVIDELVCAEQHASNTKRKVQINHHANKVDEKVNIDEEHAKLTNPDSVNMWSNLKSQVSMLMEDNLRQQSELIRRNDEKRKAIKDLCYHLDRLMEENKSLQNCPKCSKLRMKQNHPQVSKLKGLIIEKLIGIC